MHEQSCCFANINLLLFRRSRCRRRQSPIANWTIRFGIQLMRGAVLAF